MKSFLVDIPIALIFFARPDVLKETFFSIKRARPSKLFLIQDGARTGRGDDLKNIQLCRDIVKDIDWDCEVRTNFSEENLGCGMRIFSGISWAFQHVDRLAIIEDDCNPCDSFFKFCEVLLEYYKNDERLDMICGMNHLGVYEYTPYDYFFSMAASPWGWATWKRVWDSVDYDMNFLKDSDAERLIVNLFGKFMFDEGRKKLSALETGRKLSSWSYQKGLSTLLQSRLVIVPKYNLITNIGLSENSANSVSSLKYIPKGLRRIYFMKTHEIKFPLKHPKYVINDVHYKKKVDRIMGVGHPLVCFYRTCESVLYRLTAGNFSSLLKGLKSRLKR